MHGILNSNARGFVGQMTDIEIPTPRDHMYPPCLQYVISAERRRDRKWWRKSPRSRGFPTNNSLSCFRKTPSIRENPRFSTESLKKIGVLDNSQRGVWSITQTGLDFLQMDNA